MNTGWHPIRGYEIVVSDCYDPQAFEFWYRLVQRYVGRRISFWRPKLIVLKKVLVKQLKMSLYFLFIRIYKTGGWCIRGESIRSRWRSMLIAFKWLIAFCLKHVKQLAASACALHCKLLIAFLRRCLGTAMS